MRSLVPLGRRVVGELVPPCSIARRSRSTTIAKEDQGELDEPAPGTANSPSKQHQATFDVGHSGDKTLAILYQDRDYVVVDKPWDIAINTMDPVAHPVTVATLLEAILPHEIDPTCCHSFRFVHRLDFSTSGVLCIALNKRSAARISKAFHDRRTEKEYLAILKGRLLETKLIDLPIGEDSRASHKMLPVNDAYCLRNTARDAKTEFVPIEHGTLGDVEVTKTRVRLFTGRRHQIRVHALSIGHPVLGDFTYTGDDKSPRMFLHAKKIYVELSENYRLAVESTLDFHLDKATTLLKSETQ